MLTDLDLRTRSMLSEQATDFAELSRRHAARGDARRAGLAAWAADVRAVQVLLWEGELSGDSAPVEHVMSLSGAVESAVLEQQPPPSPPTLRAAVEAARAALLDCLEAPARGLLEARLAGLEHLGDLAPPAAGEANQAVVERLDGRGGEQLVGDLLTAAEDCRAVARVMGLVGDVEEAARQSAAADLAAFEAYLVLSSAASGDATLATTELRWDLAAMKAARPSAQTPPAPRAVADTASITGVDTQPPVPAVRSALRATVGPVEDSALTTVLDREPVRRER